MTSILHALVKMLTKFIVLFDEIRQFVANWVDVCTNNVRNRNFWFPWMGTKKSEVNNCWAAISFFAFQVHPTREFCTFWYPPWGAKITSGPTGFRQFVLKEQVGKNFWNFWHVRHGQFRHDIKKWQ